MASSQHRVLKLALDALSYTLRLEPDVQHVRRFLHLRGHTSWLPAGVQQTTTQLPSGLAAEWLQERNCVLPQEVVLYLHGGGFALCGPETHRALVGELVLASGAPALVPAYRKVPEHPFPAALEDALAAYCWLLDKGIKPERIMLAGDSAGGGLALSLQLLLKQKDLPLPGGSLLFSPYTDLTISGESVYQNADFDRLLPEHIMRKWASIYADGHLLDEPLVSPLFGDFYGFPPMLIQASRAEVLYDDSRRLYSRARHAGVEVSLQSWPDLVHWWHMYPGWLPEAREALMLAGLFAKNILEKNRAEKETFLSARSYTI